MKRNRAQLYRQHRQKKYLKTTIIVTNIILGVVAIGLYQTIQTKPVAQQARQARQPQQTLKQTNHAILLQKFEVEHNNIQSIKMDPVSHEYFTITQNDEHTTLQLYKPTLLQPKQTVNLPNNPKLANLTIDSKNLYITDQESNNLYTIERHNLSETTTNPINQTINPIATDHNNQTYYAISNNNELLTFNQLNDQPIKKTIVTFNNDAINNIKDIEFANGKIYAILNESTNILRINPENGQVDGVYNIKYDVDMLKNENGQTQYINALTHIDNNRFVLTFNNSNTALEFQLQ